jgi:hypothetical protein
VDGAGAGDAREGKGRGSKERAAAAHLIRSSRWIKGDGGGSRQRQRQGWRRGARNTGCECGATKTGTERASLDRLVKQVFTLICFHFKVRQGVAFL